MWAVTVGKWSALYTDDPSSNPTGDLWLKRTKINKKRAVLAHLKNKNGRGF